MATNDLNQRYTIEKYCSKTDLTRIFGTRIVEPIWKELDDFRRRLSTELPFYDAAHGRFRLTYIDPMQAKIAQTNDHVSAYVGSYVKLTAGSVAQYTFTRDMLKKALKAIAKFNNLDASEITLTRILENQEIDEQYLILSRYYVALENLKNNTSEEINEDFLAKYYGILRGEDELTCFYRISDVETSSSRSLIDRDYDNGIPSHLIDDLMPDLLQFISNSDVALATRLSAIFFMFNYVRPFDLFNMELACLLAKRIIAATNVNASCIYVPVESFINNQEFFGEISKEVKKTHDFTYAFLKGADLINEAFDVAIDRILEVHANSLDTEIKLGSDEKKIKEEFGVTTQPIKVKPVQVKKSETKAQIIAKAEQNAKHFESENLSEKELKAKAKDLLERNPYMKKAQADFYVHHCTPGKYYTIQEYVKFEHVVYETARTSLDYLAGEGFYRKQSVKNKFVYTPITKE